jgi:hypothetical protein
MNILTFFASIVVLCYACFVLAGLWIRWGDLAKKLVPVDHKSSINIKSVLTNVIIATAFSFVLSFLIGWLIGAFYVLQGMEISKESVLWLMSSWLLIILVILVNLAILFKAGALLTGTAAKYRIAQSLAIGVIFFVMQILGNYLIVRIFFNDLGVFSLGIAFRSSFLYLVGTGYIASAIAGSVWKGLRTDVA